MTRDIRPAVVRVWDHIEVGAPDECWVYNGSRHPDGYGSLWAEGRNWFAHRLAYASTRTISPELQVRHRCDNPPCCNPAHLQLGTNRDNVRDRDERGRTQMGERHWKARLTEDDVRAIRNDPRSSPVVGAEYGVHYATVLRIRQRKIWKHVA